MVATIGKQQGLKVKELIFVLTKFGKVPTRAVGDIRISKTRSFVDVPKDCVNSILKGNQDYKIGRHKFSFSVDTR